jgi:heptosyltransferase-2
MPSRSIWPVKDPKNIIVRMPNWLGDVVMATPALADLRNKWKDAAITAMCQKNVAPLLEHDPNINEIYSYKRPNGWIHRTQHMEIINDLQRGAYDLGILFTNSLSSAWWFWRGSVKNRIGYTGNFRSFLLNKAVPFPAAIEQQHLVITYKMLLAPLGIPLSNTAPALYVSPDEQKAAEEILARQGVQIGGHTLVGINPGAAYGSAKCWLPERFVSVTKRLLEDPSLYVVYFGDPTGAPLVQQICNGMPERVINLAGKTSLRELMGLIRLCRVFLTNDSGPMHMASALGVPLVALFGSTSDVKTGPYNGGKVIHKHVDCSPCYNRVCPIDFRCMKQIEVDEVVQAIYEQLSKEKPKS